MSEHDEPARLVDDAHDALGELVRAATRDVPDDARVDAMFDAVLREVGGDGDGGDDGGGGGTDGDGGTAGDGADAAAGGLAGGSGTAGTIGVGAKAGGAWLATGAGKLGAALGVAALGAGAVVWTVRSSEAPDADAPSASVIVAKGASSNGGPTAAASAREPARDDAATGASASASAPNAAPGPDARPSAAPASPTVSPDPSTAPSALTSAVASASNEPTDPRAELALLTEARAALASSPARALALADEHARRFPSSQLGQERSALRIQALAALGRTSEARAELDAFRARNPRSAYLPTLEALLAR